MKSFLIITALLFLFIFSDAQQVPDTTGSSFSQDEAQQALDFHNKVRSDIGAPPLQWSAALAAVAQKRANDNASNNCSTSHAETGYGENLFWGVGANFTALDASKAWYSEIQKYTYGPLTENNWEATGHYTQMVWSTTRQLGMGIATCANGTIIIAANYAPRGNIMGQKPY